MNLAKMAGEWLLFLYKDKDWTSGMLMYDEDNEYWYVGHGLTKARLERFSHYMVVDTNTET